MKLMAGRQYKNDLSDIVGVLFEQEQRNEPLSFEIIQKAVIDLYDSYDKIPEDSRIFIEAVYKKEDLFFRSNPAGSLQGKHLHKKLLLPAVSFQYPPGRKFPLWNYPHGQENP